MICTDLLFSITGYSESQGDWLRLDMGFLGSNVRYFDSEDLIYFNKGKVLLQPEMLQGIEFPIWVDTILL